MNQRFLMDIPRRIAYHQKIPAMMKLLKILYPDQSEQKLWMNERSCDELNEAIDRYLKGKLGKNTGGLCLDYYVRLFSNGEFDAEKVYIMESIDIIVANEDIIKKNIEDKYK